MVNVNAYNKEGLYFLILCCYQREAVMCMKQMVDLLPTVCVVSKRQQRNNIQCRLLILFASIKTNNYNISQLHLRRITPGRGVRLASISFDNKNKSE